LTIFLSRPADSTELALHPASDPVPQHVDFPACKDFGWILFFLCDPSQYASLTVLQREGVWVPLILLHPFSPLSPCLFWVAQVSAPCSQELKKMSFFSPGLNPAISFAISYSGAKPFRFEPSLLYAVRPILGAGGGAFTRGFLVIKDLVFCCTRYDFALDAFPARLFPWYRVLDSLLVLPSYNYRSSR